MILITWVCKYRLTHFHNLCIIQYFKLCFFDLANMFNTTNNKIKANVTLRTD